GADVIIPGRDPARLERAAAEVGAAGTAAFDAADRAALGRFIDGLPATVDHVMVTAGGPYYAPLAELEHDRAVRDFEMHLWLPVALAQRMAGRVPPGGSLVFIGGTGGRRPGPGLALMTAMTAALPALTANLALELAPVRVNL